MNWDLEHLFSAAQLALFVALLGFLLYHAVRKLSSVMLERIDDRFTQMDQDREELRRQILEQLKSQGENVLHQISMVQREVRHFANERPTRPEMDAKIDGVKIALFGHLGMTNPGHPFRRAEDQFFGAPPRGRDGEPDVEND